MLVGTVVLLVCTCRFVAKLCLYERKERKFFKQKDIWTAEGDGREAKVHLVLYTHICQWLLSDYQTSQSLCSDASDCQKVVSYIHSNKNGIDIYSYCSLSKSDVIDKLNIVQSSFAYSLTLFGRIRSLSKCGLDFWWCLDNCKNNY